MRKIVALAAIVALLGCVAARAEPRQQTTWVTACLGEFNKSKGWIVESQDVCKFKPADAKAILRVCGKARCKVTGLAISIPRTSDVPYFELSDIMLTHITSIRLASPEEMPGN